MRYYVFMISKSASGEERQTFGFDARDGAIQKYHNLMSNAMAGTALDSTQIIVVNSSNGIEITDKWERPVVADEVTE